MATHSRILAWRIPRTEEPGGLQSMGSQGLDTTELLNDHHSCFTMLLVSAVEQSESATLIHIYVNIQPLFLGFPSHLGHDRTLSRVPWATQLVPLFFYFWPHCMAYGILVP